MSDLFSIAASGLQAAGAQLAVTAQNIANLDTPGYQARRLDTVSLSSGGVALGGTTIDPTHGPIDADGKEGSNVDLTREVIDLKRESILYNANAKVLKVASDLTGTLLDIFSDSNHRRN